MPFPSLRIPVLVACTLAATATAATAQSSDRRRAEAERARRERLVREREAREEREYQARLRERDQARRAAEQRVRLARERAERERRTREALAARRRSDWRDSYRPRVSLGGGFDVRSFGGDDNRYLVQGGVDFRSRSGLGVRPEVLFAWTDRTSNLGFVPCAVCGGDQPLGVAQPTTRGRSRMIGVAVSGTYTLARSSPVRPYLLSGLGVFSSRTPQVAVTLVDAGIQPAVFPPTYQADVRWRNDIDVGLTAGGGLEFDLGPARLFTEFRYLLTDQPRLRGFGGMMPLTAGLRL